MYTRYVAVFDPESCDLARVPLDKINPSDYEKVQIPKHLRQFDIYTSIGLDKTSDAPTYAVVARSTDDTNGKSHLARLYYSRLGLASELQRWMSAKHRTLYIGIMPSNT
ncbi:MAG: hypothetical protein LQ348_002629 [Seirophora lacunosa]|nr:MAG: hypothetical protein LQ344_000439 [Seirophora lacunosa]KAI4194497.1 MAG: hypothetical protein LQ348_002629 [Seirophora lacunosa]